MSPRVSTPLLVLFVTGIAASVSAGRTWTDRGGRTMEAEFVGYSEGQVTVRRDGDGQLFTIPLERFSESDQEFVRSQGAAADAPLAKATWKTSTRLLLNAAAASQAQDGKVWVNSKGTRTAYILQRGGKECLVVDGKAEPLYDEVRPLNLNRDEIFFGAGDHYAYVANDGTHDRVVIDGRPEKAYGFVWTLYGCSYLSPTSALWMYVASEDDNPLERPVVVNGEEKFRIGALAKDGEILLINGHLLTYDFGDNRYHAIYDGKRIGPFDFLDSRSLVLRAQGAYAFSAKKGEDHYRVVNGRPSAAYDLTLGEVAFSLDGQHYAFTAKRKDGVEVVVLDGKELALPGSLVGTVVLSPDGKRWACSVLQEDRTAVVVDGEMVGKTYDDLAGYSSDAMAFSPDGSHFAYAAEKNGQQLVVLDGEEQQPYYEVESLRFSLDGRRLAYIARRSEDGKSLVVADGEEGKEYDRIHPGTLSFGADGRTLCYAAGVGEEGDRGFLVLDGQERTAYDRLMPKPANTLFMDTGVFSYVAVVDGAYGWIEEKRVEVEK